MLKLSRSEADYVQLLEIVEGERLPDDVLSRICDRIYHCFYRCFYGCFYGCFYDCYRAVAALLPRV